MYSVKKGLFENENFLSACLHLCDYPSLIETLFVPFNNSEYGAFQINLFSAGIAIVITVDSFVPCFVNDFYLFSFGRQSIWIQLLEKAFAQLSFGYYNIKFVDLADTYKTLTGFPVYLFTLTQMKEIELINFLIEGSLISVVPVYERHSGFPENKAFPVIKFVKLKESIFYVVRNVWRGKKFNGNFYLFSRYKEYADLYNEMNDKTLSLFSFFVISLR